MLNCFLLVFTFCGQGDNGTLSQAQSLQFKQAFGASAFAVGSHSNFNTDRVVDAIASVLGADPQIKAFASLWKVLDKTCESEAKLVSS